MPSERLEKHDESRKAAQEKLHEICNGLRAQIDKLEEKINSELEEKFTVEDNRLQAILSRVCSSDNSDISKAIQKAKAELLVGQIYDVVERNLDEDSDENEDEEPTRKKRKTERGGENDYFDITSLLN